MTLKLLFAAFFTLLFFVSCSADNSTDPIELVQQSTEADGVIALANVNNISIENLKGGVIIYSNDLEDDKINYVLSKTVKAESIEKAISYFDEIVLESNLSSNQLSISVSYPFDSDYLETYGYLDLYVPREMPCYVSNMKEGVYSFYMSNQITTRNIKDHVKIVGHSGSCDIETEKGEIEIEIVIPDSGFCKALTLDGEISVRIPKETSANLFAQTDNGTIVYENLNLSNITEQTGKISGQLGNGDSEINLVTKNGNISIVGFDWNHISQKI